MRVPQSAQLNRGAERNFQHDTHGALLNDRKRAHH